ncbi:TfoX/Sxy family protein [Lacihabitans sp. CCS-44]|uniref:TfoX/Sxy family protein n=1 Tax=Lacihabitans sp. CCS-44 TaxID=2487331 RepID=UPI0020CC1AD3|nr:TfoX/Sxy family protein [Lacihabitans sp. CCS-44]
MQKKTKIQYDTYLAEKVEIRLAKNGLTDVKKMMGGLVFMVNNKMCVGVDKDRVTGEDRLMVRVGTVPYEKLLFKKGSREMDFTGKVMRGFLFISPEGFDCDEDLDFWIEKALEFNRIEKSNKKPSN